MFGEPLPAAEGKVKHVPFHCYPNLRFPRFDSFVLECRLGETFDPAQFPNPETSCANGRGLSKRNSRIHRNGQLSSWEKGSIENPTAGRKCGDWPRASGRPCTVTKNEPQCHKVRLLSVFGSQILIHAPGTGYDPLGIEGYPLFMVQSKQVLGWDKVNCPQL